MPSCPPRREEIKTAAPPTDQPCSSQAPFVLRVPTYPPDMLNLDSQEIKKSKCGRDGGGKQDGSMCYVFDTSQKRRHRTSDHRTLRISEPFVCSYF